MNDSRLTVLMSEVDDLESLVKEMRKLKSSIVGRKMK